MADPAISFIRKIQDYLRGQFREIRFKNFDCLLAQDFTACSGGDTPQDEHMFHFVEIRIMRHGITQTSALCLINLEGKGIVGLHLFLQHHQLLRQTQTLGKNHARS